MILKVMIQIYQCSSVKTLHNCDGKLAKLHRGYINKACRLRRQLLTVSDERDNQCLLP